MWVAESQARHRRRSFLHVPTLLGHTPRPDGELSDAPFSQWYAAPVAVSGVLYSTAEHWMMAAKARLFGDEAGLDAILASATPAEAKSLGREAQYRPVQRQDRARVSAHQEVGAHGEVILVVDHVQMGHKDFTDSRIRSAGNVRAAPPTSRYAALMTANTAEGIEPYAFVAIPTRRWM